MAAGPAILVNEDHLDACSCGFNRRTQAGGAGADDNEFGPLEHQASRVGIRMPSRTSAVRAHPVPAAHIDNAIEADAHAAEQPARRRRVGRPPQHAPTRRQESVRIVSPWSASIGSSSTNTVAIAQPR